VLFILVCLPRKLTTASWKCQTRALSVQHINQTPLDCLHRKGQEKSTRKVIGDPHENANTVCGPKPQPKRLPLTQGSGTECVALNLRVDREASTPWKGELTMESETPATPDPVIVAASGQAQKLLAEAFRQLKGTGTAEAAAEPTRLFFPNGIELISVKVQAGLPAKPLVSVEPKIAGEKGLKSTMEQPGFGEPDTSFDRHDEQF